MEIDYEKKYEEALAKARAGKTLEEIFPEMNESEDERVRKFFVKHVSERIGCIEHDLKLSSKDVESEEELAMFKAGLAYLEKQKEQDKCPEFCVRSHCIGCTIYEKQKEQKSHLTVKRKGVYKICPRCKSRMIRDDSKVYTSMPPQYGYNCPKCGTMEFDTVRYDNPEMEEQKPAEWDELQADFRNINEAFEDGKKEVVAHPEKYGLCKPAEWSEEDRLILDSIIAVVEEWEDTQSDKEKAYYGATTKSDWLKSLRPQPKAELTLLDENIIEAAVAFVEQNDHFNVWRGIDKHTVLKALRSLKPQWKPSEEQMEALKEALETYKGFEEYDAMKSLYNELKKLM